MSKKKPVEKDLVALDTLKIDYAKPDSLKPNDYNPNRQSEHDFELLCKSIDEDGMTQPIIARKEDGVIVDGEHRWRACKALGFEEIPVVFVDMSLAQAKVATLRHNRARGEEDVQLAAAVLKDLVKLGATDWAMESLSLDPTEMANFIDAVDDQDGLSTEEANAIANADDEQLKRMVIEEGGTVEEHESATVQDVIRAREVRLKAARTEQERKQVIKDTSVYRLRLVFTDEQATIVRRVLGDSPIKSILRICKELSNA